MSFQVVISLVTNRPYMWPATYFNIARQHRRPDVVAIYVHNAEDYDWALQCFVTDLGKIGIRAIVVDRHVPEVLYGHAMHTTIERIVAEIPEGIILKFDDDDFYGPRYISDIVSCLNGHPDAVLLGKHALWTMWMDCKREPLFWEAPNGFPRTSDLAGPTICTPIKSYHQYPDLRYDKTLSFGIDSQYLALAKELTTDLHENGWPPVYSTGPNDFVLQRWIEPMHRHVWNPPELMTEEPPNA